MKYVLVLAWAWLIILGALMITPGGVQCLVCGVSVTRVLGLFSIIVGICHQPASCPALREQTNSLCRFGRYGVTNCVNF